MASFVDTVGSFQHFKIFTVFNIDISATNDRYCSLNRWIQIVQNFCKYRDMLPHLIIPSNSSTF